MSQPTDNVLTAPRLESISQRRIVGLSARYSLQTRGNIPAQWGRFGAYLGRIPGQIGKTSYGVCRTFTPDGQFDYLSGVEVDATAPLPGGFAEVLLREGTYAVFEHTGHVSTIAETIQAVWTQGLPESGHQAAEAPCFERYSEAFDPAGGIGGMEIWIPIQGS